MQFREPTGNGEQPFRSDSKPPWKPHVAGWNAAFFGPVAGCLVAYLSFKRMGQAGRTRSLLTSTIAFLIGSVYMTSSFSKFGLKFLTILVPIIAYGLFSGILAQDYQAWAQRNPGVLPRNGWLSIGWGLIGVVITVVGFVVFNTLTRTAVP